jgi:hypothetical protein
MMDTWSGETVATGGRRIDSLAEERVGKSRRPRRKGVLDE